MADTIYTGKITDISCNDKCSVFAIVINRRRKNRDGKNINYKLALTGFYKQCKDLKIGDKIEAKTFAKSEYLVFTGRGRWKTEIIIEELHLLNKAGEKIDTENDPNVIYQKESNKGTEKMADDLIKARQKKLFEEEEPFLIPSRAGGLDFK